MDQPNAPDQAATWPHAERRENDDAAGRRQSVVDRRSGIDRRDVSGLKRLRGPGRRRPEFNRAAEEGEFTDEQFLFVMAINEFKKANQKSFPTWTEVLEVMRKLGYRKTQPMCIQLKNATDWTEAPDAPAMPPEPDDTVEE
jgi:hypothetical protein